MDEVRVVSWYIDSLHEDLVSATWRLRTGANVPHVDLSAAPPVEEALRWMGDKWDEHRGELTDNLEALVQSLNTIRRSFEDADNALLAQVSDAVTSWRSSQ